MEEGPFGKRLRVRSERQRLLSDGCYELGADGVWRHATCGLNWCETVQWYFGVDGVTPLRSGVVFLERYSYGVRCSGCERVIQRELVELQLSRKSEVQYRGKRYCGCGNCFPFRPVVCGEGDRGDGIWRVKYLQCSDG